MSIQIRLSKHGYEIHDRGGFQTRNTKMIEMFREAYALVNKDKLPSEPVEIIIMTHDAPLDTGVPNTYHISNTREAARDAPPDFALGGWPEAYIPDFDAMAKELSLRGETPPEIDKLFWIGNTHTHPNRVKCVKMAEQYRDRMDIRAMTWIHNTPTVFITLPEHTRYRYLLDIEGGGYSARTKLFFWSRRLVFLQDRPFWDSITARLEPWIHYVPVQRDFSDLREKIEWADTHPQEVEKIIENAYAFAEKNITRKGAVEYFARWIESRFS